MVVTPLIPKVGSRSPGAAQSGVAAPATRMRSAARSWNRRDRGQRAGARPGGRDIRMAGRNGFRSTGAPFELPGRSRLAEQTGCDGHTIPEERRKTKSGQPPLVSRDEDEEGVPTYPWLMIQKNVRLVLTVLSPKTRGGLRRLSCQAYDIGPTLPRFDCPLFPMLPVHRPPDCWRREISGATF